MHLWQDIGIDPRPCPSGLIYLAYAHTAVKQPKIEKSFNIRKNKETVLHRFRPSEPHSFFRLSCDTFKLFIGSVFCIVIETLRDFSCRAYVERRQ